MNQGFWSKLDKPIIGLSPMDGVTDAAMRFITKKYGNPAMMYTEFTSAEGVARGVERLMRDFRYDESERPIVAQIFGSDPEAFYVTAKKVVELGFDGVDINMGCPAKSVAERGAGAALIINPELAGKIIKAVHRGVEGSIPVSIKTRVGYDKLVAEEWIGFLLGFDLAAIALHGRTLKQLYQGRADWEEIGRAAAVVKKSGKRTVFLGSGDIKDIADLRFKISHFGCDGGLIGRGAMGNPRIFDISHCTFDIEEEKKDKLKIAVEHARKFEELFPRESFLPMRKHLAHYAKGFEGASELRQKLVLANSADEVEKILAEW